MFVSRATSASTHNVMRRSRWAPVLSGFCFQMRRASWMGPEARAGTPPPMATRSFINVVVATRAARAHGVEALLVGDADVGEEDLVELGVAGDLAQGPDLDPGRVHVHDEVGHAPVLGDVGVGAGHQHPPARRVGQGGPHLLAVDHPLVAVAARPGWRGRPRRTRHRAR